jgi:hypothetical protein
VSGNIERAIRGVLVENFGGPLNGALIDGLTKAVLEVIGQSEVAESVDDSQAAE